MNYISVYNTNFSYSKNWTYPPLLHAFILSRYIRMYYAQLIKTLRENNTYETRVSTIINPFSLYYICDHYYGDEPRHRNFPYVPKEKHDLLVTNDISRIKEFDIIHCQVDYFNKFCNEILDKIEKKFILTTGQWYLPQIQKSELTEKILNHKNVVLWASQNPIYDNTEKYMAFPYGIEHVHLTAYVDCLLSRPVVSNIEKSKDLVYLPISNATNPCRRKLPAIPRIPVTEYYSRLTEAKFVLSPIGDRDDCFRHYEAIGLGTIPISNVNDFYKNIFTTNMIYANIDDMVKMLDKDSFHQMYEEPNKDLICLEYYKNILEKRIMNILKY